MADGFVLQTVGYSLTGSAWNGAGHSPADSTTYYLNGGTGTSASLINPATTGGLGRLSVPMPGIIRRVTFVVYTTVAASSENVTVNLYKNGSSAASLSTTMQWTAGAGANNTLNVSGLGVSVAQGDYLEVEIETPAWATNPTGVYYSFSIFVEL
jgi:hypothetical protein